MLPDGSRRHGDPLSFASIWQETAAVLKRHADVFWPIAAAFLLLPQLILGLTIGAIPAGSTNLDPALRSQLIMVGIPVLLVTLLGNLAIAFVSVFDGSAGKTVGQVIQHSFKRLLPAIGAAILLGTACALAGTMLLILFAMLMGPKAGMATGILVALVPIIWLSIRCSLMVPLIATSEMDAVTGMRTSWHMTKGYALRIAGYYGVFLVGAMMISLGVNALGMALGVVGRVAEGQGVARFLTELTGATGTAFIGLASLAFMARFMLRLTALGAGRADG